MSKFSILTPVHLWNPERVILFNRTFESLKNQTFKDFEWIVVDDGSSLPFKWDLIENAPFKSKTIHQPHEERVISLNKAFEVAGGDWFLLLDSDDELMPNALEILDKAIKDYPKEKMFNFGCAYRHKDRAATKRGPFEPKKLEVGHEEFGGGNIVNGTFIFSRSVYDNLGAFPPSYIYNIDCKQINYVGKDGNFVRDLYMGSPYDFSAASQLEFPEIRKYFMVDMHDEPDKVVKELGNPWGQDYYLFYKYTRKYHSKVLEEYLYLVNPR